jgi:hypothetical protein
MTKYWGYNDEQKAMENARRTLVCLTTIAASGGFAADKVERTLKRLKEIEESGSRK